MKRVVLFLVSLFILLSCKKETKTEVAQPDPNSTPLFTPVPSSQSQIDFSNRLIETYEFNFLNYPYIYIGGGVAIGDINNDGLQDIYFSSNQNANALYLNSDNFEFKNITEASGTADEEGWSTGVSMIDINNDGYLDIYVCKSASLNNNDLRRNKLFINQKDNSFKEKAAEYGLDHPGFSTQSYFLDYDKDGDLDMYLVNHRPDFKNNTKIDSKIQRAIVEESSDQLFRNDGDLFTKVTKEAGVLNKAWGLSASIGDFNNDDWPDIYVANDYLEPDILYINNKDGTFSNEVRDRMKHISFNSMGSDYADINNDGLQDLIVLDMLAEDHSRGKENMASMSTENFNTMVNVGYHRQYMANILQLNNGNGDFSDIGQLSGITNTDWSWAPLLADFDNDGFKDLFVTNGIEKDLGNQDFIRNIRQLNSQNKAMSLDEVLNMIPAEKLPNYIFRNNGDLTFSNKIHDWGLEQAVNSNGAAYADLDNDGDLDLVINNENELASVYKNNARSNYIAIKLEGAPLNTFALGSKLKVKSDGMEQTQELFFNRGFQSSVSPVLNFGLGNASKIESIEVKWPDGKQSILIDVDINHQIVINYNSARQVSESLKGSETRLVQEVSNAILSSPYKHQENSFNDFSKQLLLPQKQSTQGPCLSVADVNNDGLDDFYVGGASGQAGYLYLQNQNGNFSMKRIKAFNNDAKHEDIGSMFFDADGDGDMDLYVTSGGYEFQENDALLQDRLYINDGQGNYSRSQGLPKMLSSTKSVKALDFDNDNDFDLIVGGYVVPGKYPLAPNSYLLQNNGGSFSDVTESVAPELRSLGMISAMEITDIENDDGLDIILVGHWMPVTLLSLENGVFIKQDVPDFEQSHGWYESITAADLDNDGDTDYVLGNFGKNNKFHPTPEKPLHIFSADFDDNGSYDIALSKYYKGELVPVRGKECSSEQTPFLNEKIASYKEFASLNIEGIYGENLIQNADQKQIYTLESKILENLGNGKFSLKDLPNLAQMAPTLDIEIIDLNRDGILDIVGVGNLYDTEVETIRYDASRGYILLGNRSGEFTSLRNSGLLIDKDMRQIASIRIGDRPHFIIASNNDDLTIYELIN